MPAMHRARPLGSTLVSRPFLGFPGGVIGGRSDLGRNVDYFRRVNNVIFEPTGAFGIRKGTRDASTAFFSTRPHSIMRYYEVGANRTFVGAKGNWMYELLPTVKNQFILPQAATDAKWSSCNLNHALIATQEGGTNLPIAFDNLYVSFQLVTPVAPTAVLGFTADTVGGLVDVGTHYYRFRYRFRNGSSVAGPSSAAHVVAGPNQTVHVTGFTVNAQPDFLGWTLERTKVTDATLWYFVADGTGTAAYVDSVSDASLSSLIGAEPGVHGAAPHFDGVVAFKDLLLGWSGSTLYVSQPIGGPEGSGIFNFHPNHWIPVHADDGDIIKTCVQQGDRLIVLKGASVHAVEGFDWDSFRLVNIDDAVGSVSTRGATMLGGTLFFYAGGGRLYALPPNGKPVRVGEIEMGHYLVEIAPAQEADVELYGHRGDYLLTCYATASDVSNRHIVAYRPANKTWTHWLDMTIKGALVPRKADDFNRASFMYCGPNNTSFPAIAAGSTITGGGGGIGIPGGTTVLNEVLAGATTLTMSAGASTDVFDGDIVVNGTVLIHHCNTVSGSAIVTIENYHVWVGFDGFGDQRASDGTGGVDVEWMAQTPEIDDGMPDVVKLFDRLEGYVHTGNGTLNINVSLDSGISETSTSVNLHSSSPVWGQRGVAPKANTLVWGPGPWVNYPVNPHRWGSSSGSSEIVAPFPPGAAGKKYRMTLTARLQTELVMSGMVLDYRLTPERKY